MFRHSVRRLAVAAAKASEPSAYTLAVSKAQGVAKGLTGGTYGRLINFYVIELRLYYEAG